MSEQTTATPAPTTGSPVALWSPTVVSVVTFLLSFPAGIVLAAINWYRMGMRSKAGSHLLVGAVGAVVVAVVVLAAPGSIGRVIGLAVTLGAIWYLRKQMTEDIDDFKATHPVVVANWLIGVLIGVGVFVVFIILIFVIAAILPSP